MEDQEDTRTNPMMLIITLSVIIAGLVMIVFAVLFVVRRSTPGETQSGPSPYAISSRSVPDTTDPAAIMPERLGNFKRGSITGDIQDFDTTYTDGTNKIDVSGSQGVSLRAVQASVSSVSSQIVNSAIPIQRQLDKDPSFVLIPQPNSVRFAWSHDRWFFDVKANSQAALDAFMNVFKY